MSYVAKHRQIRRLLHSVSKNILKNQIFLMCEVNPQFSSPVMSLVLAELLKALIPKDCRISYCSVYSKCPHFLAIISFPLVTVLYLTDPKDSSPLTKTSVWHYQISHLISWPLLPLLLDQVLEELACFEPLRRLLCGMFLPQCSPLGGVVQPCRSVCTSAEQRCSHALDTLSFSWPFNCNLLRDSQDTVECSIP